MADEMTPITRYEHFAVGTDMTPITRIEKILAGEDVTPITRREYFTKKAVEGGGGDIPAYEGAYTVTPSEQTQTLETRQKRMTANVTVNPIPSEYIVPSGTVNITQNETVNVAEYASASVNVQPPLEDKGTINPTSTEQDITPSSGYYGISHIKIGATGGTDFYKFAIESNGFYQNASNNYGHFDSSVANGDYEIPDGIKRIGSNKFASNSALTSVDIPSSVKEIGDAVFHTIQIQTPHFANDFSTFGAACFANSTLIGDFTIPNGVTQIPDSCFNGATINGKLIWSPGVTKCSRSFKNVNIRDGVYVSDLSAYLRMTVGIDDDSAFPLYNHADLYVNNVLVTDLVIPNDITKLLIYSMNGFNGTSVRLHSGITQVNISFMGCPNLTTVYFYGTPSSVHNRAFQNDTAIADFYVPWSSGAVAGAPWGAVNATIHYDSDPISYPTP